MSERPEVRHAYVHVPFCARRCSYCDFAIAVRRDVPVDDFIAAVDRELTVRALSTPLPLETLYFGGGTPSRLGGEGLARLVQAVAARLPLTVNAEVTVEANPEDVTPKVATRWAEAGVNRVSLGVQSFDERVLDWMHRGHGADAPGAAITALRDAGIANISVDLIYALPEGLGRNWSDDITRALALNPDHLSCYGLTVEPATPLGRWVERGETAPPGEEHYESDFLETHERLTSVGFSHYEVSNYALPGRQSRHNSSYWRGVPYLGIGPSAHGFDGRVRRWNVREFAAWARQLDDGADPIGGSESLTQEQLAIEAAYLGLRAQTGLKLQWADVSLVASWVREGWATVAHETLRLTPMGWLRLDALVAALTDHRSRY